MMDPITDQERTLVSMEIEDMIKVELNGVWETTQKGLFVYPAMEDLRPDLKDSFLSTIQGFCSREGLTLLYLEQITEEFLITSASVSLHLDLYFKYEQDKVLESERRKKKQKEENPKRFAYLPVNIQPAMSYFHHRLKKLCRETPEFHMNLESVKMIHKQFPSRNKDWTKVKTVKATIQITKEALKLNCDAHSHIFSKTTVQATNTCVRRCVENWDSPLDSPLVRQVLRGIRLDRGRRGIGEGFRTHTSYQDDPRSGDLPRPLGDVLQICSLDTDRQVKGYRTKPPMRNDNRKRESNSSPQHKEGDDREVKHKGYYTSPRTEVVDLDESDSEDSKDLEIEEVVHLAKITTSMHESIESYCNAVSSIVLIDNYNIQIFRKDIDTLKGLNWLNDSIIDFYMQMIQKRSRTPGYLKVYAANSYFYTKLMSSDHSSIKRWTKNIDIFSCDLMFIPIYLGMHWCLAVIDFRKFGIYYYDSMGGNNQNCVEALLQYIQDEFREKKRRRLDVKRLSTKMVKNIPQQFNGSDCGMFACKFAEYLSRDASISFSQKDMPHFRRRMIWEIVQDTLLHP